METVLEGFSVDATHKTFYSPSERFKDILECVQQLQREEGGVIWVGVEDGRCVGCRMSSQQSWVMLMEKLDNFLKITERNSQITYKHYQIGDDYYATKMEVAVSTTIEKELTERRYSKEEDEHLELKLSFNFLQTKDGIAKYISAFANTNGGKIVVGVADDGKIIGMDMRNQSEWDKIKLSIVNTRYKLTDKMIVSEINMERFVLPNKKYVAEITIPKHKGDDIYAKDNDGNWNKWVRVQSSCMKVDQMVLQSKSKISQLEKKYMELNENYEIIFEKYKKYKKCAVQMDEACAKKVAELKEKVKELEKTNDVRINLEVENTYYKEKTVLFDEYIRNIVGKSYPINRCYNIQVLIASFFIIGLVFFRELVLT